MAAGDDHEQLKHLSISFRDDLGGGVIEGGGGIGWMGRDEKFAMLERRKFVENLYCLFLFLLFFVFIIYVFISILCSNICLAGKQ